MDLPTLFRIEHFFENIESCMSCMENVKVCDMIFSDDSEEDDGEYEDVY